MTNITAGTKSDPAPFKCSPMLVEPQWTDYNGHLNMAYYNVLFDRALDEVFAAVGLGPDYLKTSHHSSFTAEAHVTYLNELHAGEMVTIAFRLLDYDEKRLHSFEEMYSSDGTLSATSEQMSLHVDMESRKVAPFPQAILDRLKAMHRSHAALANSPQVGHVIGIRRKPR